MLLACGDDASTGSGGSGAEGGTGAQGVTGTQASTGGSGGSGGAMCEGGGGAGEGGGVAECRALAHQNISVGFASPPAPGSYPIAAVTPNSLQIGGETLQWVGPDLTTRFTVGETITLGRTGEWDSVESATVRLATLKVGALGHLGFLQPPFGPVLAPADSQCSYETPSHCSCELDGIALYRLSATMGDAVQSIAVGNTQSLGGWDITNGKSQQTFGASTFDCQGEDYFDAQLTLIGPAAPL